ncbi:uncharacterized protein LOC133444351 [Cololabis saira]|uniref:uncharacterized protein LOC133444351 n=1 Tax=Cololabis saira TaxID=129043 RepID=UPI002AD3F5E9|nr:uncharacterized protein LOC133444351 [Cololabis saira]
MALPFGVSWICVLLWACIYFPPQNGYKIADGYYLYEGQQTPNQVNPWESSEANCVDETMAVGQQSSFSQQPEPVSYRNRHQVTPFKSFSEEKVQRHPDPADMEDRFIMAHPDKSRHFWRRQNANHQVPGSAANFMSPSVYGNQIFTPRPALYLDNSAAAIGPVSNNVVHATPPVQSVSKNQYVHYSSKEPQQTWSPLNPPNNPSQDFSYFSRKPSPSADGQNGFKPKYVSHKKHPSRGYQKPSGGFEHGKGLSSVTRPDVLYPQKPQSSHSYVPRSDIYTPNPASKYKEKTYDANGGKKSKAVYYTPSTHQPASSDSVSTLNIASPQSKGHNGFITSTPHGPQRRDYSYTGYRTIDPSTFHQTSSVWATEDGNKPDFKNQNLTPAPREPKEKAITKYRGRDVTRRKPVSHRRRNQPNSLSAQDRFLYLNGGYNEAMKAGLIKTSNQLPDPHMLLASMNKGPVNLDSWPSKKLLDSRGTDANCVVWLDTNHHPQKFHKSSRSPVNTYVKSKNRSARGTVHMSKTCFKPQNRFARGKAAKRQWKLALRRKRQN